MSIASLSDVFSEQDFLVSKEVELGKGEIFLFEGDKAEKQCYLLQSGVLEVRLVSGTGHETVLYHLQAGDLVGELPLFGLDMRTATVAAISPVKLLEISEEVFKTAMGEPDFCKKVIAHFLKRFLKTHDVVCRLSQPNIGMKLCHYFKTLVEASGEEMKADKVFVKTPSHAAMAKLLSCQRESVTREIKKLVQAGIISPVQSGGYMLHIPEVDLYLGGLLE